MKEFIIGIDEGTTSLRVALYDCNKNKIIKIYSSEIPMVSNSNNYIEQDAQYIWKEIVKLLKQVISDYKLNDKNTYGIAITNQRETIVAWEKSSGKTLYSAITWQDNRTKDFCASFNKNDCDYIKKTTGLIINSYFSASKIKWLLDNCLKVKKHKEKNNICFGTIDSYLIYKLTKGSIFATDITNASRTMLVNIKTGKYDEKLLKMFNVDSSTLPQILSNDKNFGTAKIGKLSLPIISCIGDQQSSLFGLGCIHIGETKNTYGTGGFVMTNIGQKFRTIDGLLTTVALKFDDKITFAIEGSIFSVGTVINWLKDMSFFDTYDQIEKIYNSTDEKDMIFIPAFSGLGAPYWNENARAGFCNVKDKYELNCFTKAALQSIIFRTNDILECMQNNDIKIKSIKVDGGASKNNCLMQFQADISNIVVQRVETSEKTILGTIYMGAVNCGHYSTDDVLNQTKVEKQFTPAITKEERQKKISNWKKAINMYNKV